MLIHTCKAFVNGVPQDIIFDRVKHTSPYPGDNGIMFQKREVKD